MKIFGKTPKQILAAVLNHTILRLTSDETVVKVMYRLKLGKKLDLNNPKTYNEKLQWLKLYDRNPEYSRIVDKAAFKDYIKEKLGDGYTVPTLGRWDRFEDIDFSKLPDRFVLKCNHDSGGLVICKDKSKLDIEAAKKKIKKCLKQNYYYASREWPYKNVKPCIIAEEYMQDDKTSELRDYKFFCFNGKVEMLFVASERQKTGEEVKFDFFDTDFNHLDFRQGHPNAKQYPEKPEKFDEMIEIAAKLSEGIPQIRVDFYEVNGKIYVGELTFFHFGGMVPFEPDEWDKKLGDYIDLSIANKR